MRLSTGLVLTHCCCASCVTDGPGSGRTPGAACGAAAAVGGDSGSVARRPAADSTHVSFEPPPWLELTTTLPSGSATLVSPPGTTHTLSPSLTANGRKS